MIVRDLIAKLQQMPQDIPVFVNDERGGTLHEEVDVFHDPGSVQEGYLAAAIIVVNSDEFDCDPTAEVAVTAVATQAIFTSLT